MKRFNTSNSFTLIELIVVMVILGVLVGLSIKACFITIEQAKGTDGISYLQNIKNHVDPCTFMATSAATFNNCFNGLGADEPPNFNYEWTNYDYATGNYQVVIQRRPVTGDPGGDIPPCGTWGSIHENQSGIAICHIGGVSTLKGWGWYDGVLR